ncbi:hypothetical protein ACM0P6_02960 [Komagataeibacter sucrofermentans]|uniref:Uncharacterized protein n=1 Tax=Komagataeibacter sucrofermentans TaxID=1053551 RepID=A0A318R2H5_9PROT|nr:hypothetical protein [Komagataeibacter sucrofermentans]PYD79963.1 hypothetical protein CFR77_05485 [Komagataeibacter sucrofermentans]GBQ52197.1 hypothetical protein AA15973_2690 [Komagataeibacter sucrofermentans DSM 15973]
MIRFLLVKLGRAMERAGYEFARTPDMPPPITVKEFLLRERIRNLSISLATPDLSPERNRQAKNQLDHLQRSLSALERQRLSAAGLQE